MHMAWLIRAGTNPAFVCNNLHSNVSIHGHTKHRRCVLCTSVIRQSTQAPPRGAEGGAPGKGWGIPRNDAGIRTLDAVCLCCPCCFRSLYLQYVPAASSEQAACTLLPCCRRGATGMQSVSSCVRCQARRGSDASHAPRSPESQWAAWAARAVDMVRLEPWTWTTACVRAHARCGARRPGTPGGDDVKFPLPDAVAASPPAPRPTAHRPRAASRRPQAMKREAGRGGPVATAYCASRHRGRALMHHQSSAVSGLELCADVSSVPVASRLAARSRRFV